MENLLLISHPGLFKNTNDPIQTPLIPARTPLIPARTPLIPVRTPLIPVRTPIIPVRTPIIPVRTPIIPVRTPVIPVRTPVIPVRTPVIPVRTPVIPVRTPIIHVRTPVIPVRTPVIPVRTPVIPVRTPIIHVRTPVIPVRTPVIPVRTPVIPVITPIIPVRAPVIPVRTPVIPVRTPVIHVRTPVIPVRTPVIPVRNSIIPKQISNIDENKNKNINIRPQISKPDIEKFKIEEVIDCNNFNNIENINVSIIHNSGGEWKVNEEFVLHFLLDGYLSDYLGNSKENVANRFIEITHQIPNMKSLGDEIKFGSEHGMYSDIIYKSDKSIDIEQEIEYGANKIPDIRTNIIVAGGYRAPSGGHATSFRFLPSLNQIIFINSGEGLTKNHSSYGEFYKLYKIWKFDTNTLFQKYSKLIISAIDSPYINNITDAYKYQINVIPSQYEINIHFKNNGTVLESTDIWMTHISNFIIIDSELYCKPQLAGTCTFHSVFWQLLIFRWIDGGSLSASVFEREARYYLLDKAIYLGPPIEPKISEQISCLQLLVRTYPNFKRRDEALQTLMLSTEKKYYNIDPKYTKTLPVDEITVPISNILNLSKWLHEIQETKYINDALSPLYQLLNTSLDEIILIYDYPNIKKENEQKLFSLYIRLICGEAIKYIDKLSLYETTEELLMLAVRCLKLIRLIPTMSYLIHTDSMFLGIIGRIHSKLPNNLRLPPNSIKYQSNNTIRCSTLLFIRDYKYYSYSDNNGEGLDINDPIVIQWKTHTGKKSIPQSYMFINDSKNSDPQSIAFNNFKNSSIVNHCISSSFIIMSTLIFDEKYVKWYKNNIWDITPITHIKDDGSSFFNK